MEKVSELEKKLLHTHKEAELLKVQYPSVPGSDSSGSGLQRMTEPTCVSQESLHESRSRLQNQTPEPAGLGSLEALKELQLGVQVLVEQGLIWVERSPSGQLEVQVVHQENLRGQDQVLKVSPELHQTVQLDSHLVLFYKCS